MRTRTNPATLVAEKLHDSGQALYLGKVAGDPAFAGRENHLLTLGPTGSGKTSGLIIPSVAVHPGPTVVVSTNPDIIPAVHDARSAIAAARGGTVAELGLGEVSGKVPCVNWSATDGCDDWNTAVSRADVLARTGMQVSNDSFWRDAASDLLAGCLFGAALLGDNDRTMAHWIKSTNVSRYYSAVVEHCADDHQAPYMFGGIVNDDAMAADTRRSVFATVSAQALAPFRYQQEASTATFDLQSFVRSWGTIFVTIPWHRTETYKPLVSAFVEGIVDAWRRFKGGDTTLLLALDEVANVAPLPNLPKIITAGRGLGIQVLLGMQEPGQASCWRDEAKVILGGPTHLALYPGLKDTDYLNSIATLIGTEVKYDIEVHVKDETPGGPRFADHHRLMQERQAIEEARKGKAGRQAHIAALRVALRIATQRLREGVRCRENDGAGLPGAVLDEIERYTTVKQVPKRLPRIDVDQLSDGRPGHFFLRCPEHSEFRSFRPWFEDAFWREVLA